MENASQNISDDDEEVDIVENMNKTTPLILDGTFFSIIKEMMDSKHKSILVTAKCTFCKMDIKGSLAASTNFLNHLKKKHPGEYERYVKYKDKNYVQPAKKQKLNSSQPLISNKFNSNPNVLTIQKSFDKSYQKKAITLIAQYIIESASPFRTVELTSFKNLIVEISKMNTPLTCPTRRSTTNTIDQMAKDMKQEIIDKIKNNKFFCTTADIWSAHRRSYLGRIYFIYRFLIF